jgi:hypothetical protein
MDGCLRHQLVSYVTVISIKRIWSVWLGVLPPSLPLPSLSPLLLLSPSKLLLPPIASIR